MYQPRYTISPFLLKTITQITELRSWILKSTVDVPWVSHLQRETTSRTAHASTAIEGNPLSLSEVEALARGEELGGVPTIENEVKNYLEALRWIQNKNRKITEKNLLNLHRIVTKNLLDIEKSGKYKIQNNRIIDHKRYTLYTPPPADQTQLITQNLVQWITEKETKILHPLIISAIAHHQLVSIHPFTDGNGRTSRLLALWIFYQFNFDTHHILAMDDYFQSDRKKYYTMLQQVRDLDHDLTFWIEYVSIGMLEVLERTKKRIESLKISELSSKIRLNKTQETILRILRDKGRIKSQEIQTLFSISRARASQLLKPLADSNLIIREGSTRSTTYRIAENQDFIMSE